MVSRKWILALLLVGASGPGLAQQVEDFSATIETFRQVPEVGPYFDTAYGFAIWDNIAMVGLGIGAAGGRGQVYVNGQVTGFSRMLDLSPGLQAGGQAYRQIIFFEDRLAYDEFTLGNFEFDASASAVAVTASAQTSSGTQGSQATVAASGAGRALASGNYQNGVRVFTMAIGGLMAQVTIAGQKYNFRSVFRSVLPVPTAN